MSETNQSLEEFLFEVALAKSSKSERVAFLDGVCRDNPALRARLEVLLEGHFQAQGFLVDGTRKVEQKPASPPAEEETGSTFIGRYKLLERIGEGGFGEVWMAEQKEPVKRRVALKIIKLGMDTKQVVARFEAERQALALMDHPNIAKVLDAGATETGRPYFVMELVRGIRITEYCDQNQLSTAERLQLFVQVCRAIQHAHQKGIIHRDIKPSNILLTLHDGVPVPKVIDFGIAKATQMELTDKTVFTQFRLFLGTPAYVSPEQASMSGLDIDTRSDIYSLGVLLYELLTGTTPFDTQELIKAGLEGMRQIIREREPARPSTRLTRELTAKQTDATGHSKIKNQKSKISPDLDWIVMKCLEKDRARRYETANGLAGDIKRHLNNEPVTARPPSRLYEFQKTVRRHWVGFAAVAAVVAALGIGLMVSAFEATRARRAGERALVGERLAQQAQANEANQKVAAQQFLYNSLVREARATRLARRVGYRDQVFALLKRAKALDVPEKSLADLRQEAVACLGDFVGLTPTTLTDFPTNISVMSKGPELAACIAPSGRLAAFGLDDSSIRLRALPSGKELARLTVMSGIFRGLCFNRAGDQLFAIADSVAADWAQSLSKRWVYAWASDEDGHWRPTENHEVAGATGPMFSTQAGVFVPVLELGLTNAISFGTANDNSAKAAYVRYRLLNLSSNTFVARYAVTNPAPPFLGVACIRACPSPDGRLLAVETWDIRPPKNSLAVVNLYDWQTGTWLNQLLVPGYGWTSFSQDAKYFACSSDLGAAIYTVPDLQRVANCGTDSYGELIFWGAGLALPGQGQLRIHLWDFASAEDFPLMDEEGALPIAASPDGSSLFTVGPGHARVYRLTTPEKLYLRPHAGAVPGAAFSPDGLRLASVGKDHVLRVCDALTGRTLWETNDLPGLGQCVSFSPDGELLVTGYGDTDLVRIRDAQTGEALVELGDGGAWFECSALFSPDGRYLATTGDFTNGTKIWRIHRGGQSGEGNRALKATLVKSSAGGKSLSFSPDGRLVAFVGLEDPRYALWDTADRPIYVWDFENSPQPRRLVTSRIRGYVECEGFTPDGQRLVALEDSGEILTLDATTGKSVSASHAEDTLTWTAVEVQLSPDAAKLAVGIGTPSGGAVSLSDPKTGKHLYSLPAEAGGVHWLAWSRDSRRLAVARENGKLAIWNLETVERILADLGLNP